MIAKKSFFFIFIIKSEDLQASSIQLFNFILRQTKTNFIINRLNLTQKNYLFFAWLLNSKKKLFWSKLWLQNATKNIKCTVVKILKKSLIQ